MLLVVALGLLKLLWVVGCAGHLKKYGADAVNGAQVVGVDAEHFLEFRDGLVVLAVLEGVDTLIEEVASLQLVASGNSDDHQQSSRACQGLERGAGRLGAK